MKKFFVIFGYCILGLLVLAYIGFLFVLPNVADINQFKPEVQKIAKEQANLSVNFENAKIITTPLLGAGIKVDNIEVKLPDNSILFSADNLKTRISIPSIFVLTVKVSCLEVNNPFVNLEIVNNQQYKVVSLIEDILNQGKEQKLETGENPANVQTGWFNPAWIRIKVPNIVLNNYKVLVKDLKTGHYLNLCGEKLQLGYFNGKTAKIKTYAELYSDKNRNVTANININTFLPPPAPGLDEEDDRAERIEIPFVNAVEMYQKYELKTNIDANLRIRNGKRGIKSYGHFNIEDLTLKISNLTIPNSYFLARTFGQTVNIDSNIYLTKDQNIEVLGKLNYSKHPKMDMIFKTTEIKFNDVLNIGKAFLNSLGVQHELDNFTANGTVKADCSIKTNFKKLKSSGSIIVRNGEVSVKQLGRIISKANVNILLDNNVLNIKESGLYVDNSKIDIDGKIDNKSIADINIDADKIPLGMLFNAFAPKNIREQYIFRSGDATIHLALKGKLKEAVATLKAGLDNLYISDKGRNFVITNKSFATDFFCNKKTLGGVITNKGLSVLLPKTSSSIQIPEFETSVADKNITIKENKIKFNDNSMLNYSGEIIDYEKIKSIAFSLNGGISTEDVIKIIGKELKPYIHSNGVIPVKLTFDGDKRRQTLFVQALSDKNNFITPIDIVELSDKNTSLQSVIDFKGNRIKIKKTGFYIRTVSVDDDGNEVVKLDEVLGIDGTVMGQRINLLKIVMPKELNGKIYVFPKSSFKLNGKAFVFGETSHPRMRGGFAISNLSIPEILTDLRKAELRFKGSLIEVSADDLILNGSDLNIKAAFNLIQQKIFTVSNLIVNSRYFNLDKVMKVSERAMKYVPQQASNTKSSSSGTADIPLVVSDGAISFTRIKTGNINLSNTVSKILLRNNIFYLNNLRTNVFNGNINGNISVNLLSMLLNIDVTGHNVNVEQAMADAMGMKDMLSGTAEFNTDISLQGATIEEQMKSLKGTVDFSVKHGQYGPFGKLENLILAENIRESEFFQTALGGMMSGLMTIDTTHFEELAGDLSFNDGICNINSITSSGDILALHMFGNFDLLKNRIDMKVRARMASLVSNLLGPLSAINPVNLVNSAASMNVITAKAFSLFCETVPAEEIDKLPNFANKYVDKSATKFQIVVRGDVAKPLTLVKSFKWLTTQMEFAKAKEFADALPVPDESAQTESIEEVIEEQNSFGYKAKQFGKKIIHPFSEKEAQTQDENITETAAQEQPSESEAGQDKD